MGHFSPSIEQKVLGVVVWCSYNGRKNHLRVYRCLFDDKVNTSGNNFNYKYNNNFLLLLERNKLSPQHPLTTTNDYLAAQKQTVASQNKARR